MMESISELRGIWVVDTERGALLGTVSGVTIDRNEGTIAGLIYRGKKANKHQFFLTKAQVDKIGRDVVLVRTDEGTAIEDGVDVPGIGLEELQGCWVTTLAGKHIGTLVDIDFSTTDWKITELELAHGMRLAVEADKLKIGDEILVPAGAETNVTEAPKERYGAFGRLLGTERINDLRRALKKTLERKPKEDTEKKEPTDEE